MHCTPMPFSVNSRLRYRLGTCRHTFLSPRLPSNRLETLLASMRRHFFRTFLSISTETWFLTLQTITTIAWTMEMGPQSTWIMCCCQTCIHTYALNIVEGL